MPQQIDRLAAALADRYRLERELGAGGMATVYLAHDVRHDRKVALKVLRPELSAIVGADRFLAEIRTTANLQHPHILPLHDSGEADGIVFYIMPYVEGESLRDRLNREKQLPVGDAVRIAREVADALDYAHRHGVIHRDIKPENILLHGGHAMVADFGIALAVSRSDGGTRMTETGMSLGTPHYMSPEQAMGEREITAQSDLYALGCVLYEMLTGEPPFTGPTAQAIVARVMTEEPRALSIQRRTIPPHIDAAVQVALAKLPADRFASGAEFVAALEGSAVGPLRPPAPGRRIPANATRGLRILVAALALGVTFAGGWFVALRGRPEGSPLRVSLNLPEDQRLAIGLDPAAALSPDGLELVYSGEAVGGTPRLYSRRLDQLTPVPLAGTDGGCCPVISPDGEWILFAAVDGSGFRRVPSRGGAATTIPAPAGSVINAIRWAGSDGFMTTMTDGSLARLRTDGTLDVVAKPDTTAQQAALTIMQVLPGGAVLAIAETSPPDGPLVAVDPHTGRQTVVISSPVLWAGYAEGYLVWSGVDGVLYASQFDPSRARLTGAVLALGANAQVTRGGRPKLALADGGALAYVPAQPLSLVKVDRGGRVSPILEQPRSYHSPRVSPDGRKILFDFSESSRDVWLLDLRDTTITRVSFENDGHDPTWLPGGHQFLFGSSRGNQIGVFRRNIDGSGKADSVLVEGAQITVHAVTPDGRTGIAAKVVTGGGTSSDFDLVTVPLLGGGKSRPLVATRYIEDYPAVSPDGRWLAYVSTESNRPEVYVRPLGGEGGKLLVSQNGGSEPVWSRDGPELFYRSLGPREPKLVAAAIETSPDLRVRSRTTLFDISEYETAVPHANYDVMPDGQNFIFVRQGRLSEFVYLRRWTELLPRQSAAGAR
jgi:Tol biopolymer transport system component